jgi:hypothetical protein
MKEAWVPVVPCAPRNLRSDLTRDISSRTMRRSCIHWHVPGTHKLVMLDSRMSGGVDDFMREIQQNEGKCEVMGQVHLRRPTVMSCAGW